MRRPNVPHEMVSFVVWMMMIMMIWCEIAAPKGAIATDCFTTDCNMEGNDS